MPLRLVALYGLLGSSVDDIIDKLCERGYKLLPNFSSSVEPETIINLWSVEIKDDHKYIIRLRYVNEYIAAQCLKFTSMYIRSTWMERFTNLSKRKFPPNKISMKYEDTEDLQYYEPATLFKILV